MKDILTLSMFLLIVVFTTNGQNRIFPYQNSQLSVEDRVKDLLGRMSLDEKVRQMDMYKGGSFKANEKSS